MKLRQGNTVCQNAYGAAKGIAGAAYWAYFENRRLDHSLIVYERLLKTGIANTGKCRNWQEACNRSDAGRVPEESR
jgi:hypothetical protein